MKDVQKSLMKPKTVKIKPTKQQVVTPRGTAIKQNGITRGKIK